MSLVGDLAKLGLLPLKPALGKNVRNYGAVGNGVADDTLALRRTITAAGVGGIIVLNAADTYLVSGQLELLVGQTVIAYGAKIKRRNQISTTTTEAITNPETAIDVASVTGLSVGMNVTFAEPGVAQADLVAGSTLSTVNSEITAINGLTLTLASSPNASLSTGANVYLSFNTVVLAKDCKVYGLEIDGNKANWPWSRWEVTNEFHMASDAERTVIENCYIHDASGEGMQVIGLYASILHNHLKDLNGNGIHMSAATHPLIDGNTVINCNLDPDVGHADGCIVWSNSVTDATVVNNHMVNGETGIASVDSAGNSHVTVTGNTIRNCTAHGVRIEGAAADLTIAHNRIYSCGSGSNGGLYVLNNTGIGLNILGNTFGNNSVQISGATQIAFRNNYLDTAGLLLATITNGQICGNTLYGGGISFSALTGCALNDNYIDRSGDTTNPCIQATTGTANLQTSVSRNQCIAGSQGIKITSNGNVDLNVSGNHCRSNFAAAINVDSTGTQAGANVADNSCAPTTASASSWVGVRIQSDGVTVKGNHVYSPSSGRANYGIQVDKKTMVLNNYVRGAYSVGSIRVAATSTDSLVQDNYITTAISDLGTTTTLTNNTTVAA